MNVGIQPYTMSALEEPLTSKLGRLARVGFEGVELNTDDNSEAIREVLTEQNLAVSSIASGLEALDEDLDAHVAASEAFETDKVVVMWIGPGEFQTREGVETVAQRLDSEADRLADHDLQLHYHNHAHEFTALGETTGFEALVEATDTVQFEIDVGWAGVGGVDPVDLLDDIGERVTLVHAKDIDFASGEFCTFGEGDLDVGAAVSAARCNGVDWFIWENDEPIDPVAEPSHASLLLDEHTGHLGRTGPATECERD